MQDLTRTILTIGDLDEHSQGGRLWLLSRFAMEWQCLEVAGSLFPSLLELYQWLHTDIAHLITREQASSMTIGRVISLAKGNLEKQSGEHVLKLYEKVKQDYSRYVELAGTTAHDNKISDDIPVLQFLTGKDHEQYWMTLSVNL